MVHLQFVLSVVTNCYCKTIMIDSSYNKGMSYVVQLTMNNCHLQCCPISVLSNDELTNADFK